MQVILNEASYTMKDELGFGCLKKSFITSDLSKDWVCTLAQGDDDWKQKGEDDWNQQHWKAHDNRSTDLGGGFSLREHVVQHKKTAGWKRSKFEDIDS